MQRQQWTNLWRNRFDIRLKVRIIYSSFILELILRWDFSTFLHNVWDPNTALMWRPSTLSPSSWLSDSHHSPPPSLHRRRHASLAQQLNKYKLLQWTKFKEEVSVLIRRKFSLRLFPPPTVWVTPQSNILVVWGSPTSLHAAHHPAVVYNKNKPQT